MVKLIKQYLNLGIEKYNKEIHTLDLMSYNINKQINWNNYTVEKENLINEFKVKHFEEMEDRTSDDELELKISKALLKNSKL